MLREEQNSGVGREKELAIEFSKSWGVVPEFIVSGTYFSVTCMDFLVFWLRSVFHFEEYLSVNLKINTDNFGEVMACGPGDPVFGRLPLVG